MHWTNRSITIFLAATLMHAASAAADSTSAPEIQWDPSTLRLVQSDGAYARIIHVRDSLLCCFEWRGACWVRHSADGGMTWRPAVEAARYPAGHAANPAMLACKDGSILLFYNGRPAQPPSPFLIAASLSHDGGDTWTPLPHSIFVAGDRFGVGCYEPAAVQEQDGTIDLLFADEWSCRSDKNGQQQITLMQSHDNGQHWSQPHALSLRVGGRDGMPAPLLLRDSAQLAFAIEDNGIGDGHQLQPAMIRLPVSQLMAHAPVSGQSPRRSNPLDHPLPADVYAGAPDLQQFPCGVTVLSCQSNQDDARHRRHMVVYLGDASGAHFGAPSRPFPGPSESLWNSLLIKNAGTVTAVATTTINQRRGIWTIDGSLGLKPATTAP